jgi:2,5-furandicarboxylate decarboxylase 1
MSEPHMRPVSLRSFLDDIEAAGELRRYVEPISLRDIARITESSDEAILFERPAGCDTSLLANSMGSRSRWAIALGVETGQIIPEISSRLGRAIEPVLVDDGPVREVVQVGDDVDVTRLPAYLQHALDGGPYISAAMDVTRSETGRYNTGVRRLMLRGARETGVDVVAPSDLRAAYREAREQGRPFEIAFVVGTHPLDYLATQMRGGDLDEFALMGGIRGSAVPLVQCETVDLRVPADAEIVLEGRLEGDWINLEGPYGEYHGCYGAAHRNPLFRLTAITRRRDAIFQTATIGGRHLQRTDTAVITAIAIELRVWEAVSRAIARPLQVYSPPSASGQHHVRICLQTRDPGDGRNAVLAALASNADIKMATAVDEDIDIFSDAMTEWAVSTRFQADRDTIVLGGMRTFPLDPSLPPRDEAPKVTGGKLGIDATRRYDRPKELFDYTRPPFEEPTHPDGAPSDGQRLDDVAALADSLLASLQGGGARFVDLLAARPDVHSGDLIRALGMLRDAARVTQEEDGRFVVAA